MVSSDLELYNCTLHFCSLVNGAFDAVPKLYIYQVESSEDGKTSTEHSDSGGSTSGE